MLPSIVFTTLPIPSFLLLLIITLYHLTPLLTLLPNLTPSLQKLANVIPHPRRARNLPREFFNLPPRPGSPVPTTLDLSVRGRLGVRGGLMLILLVEAIVSLACGWAGLSSLSSTSLGASDAVEGLKWGLVGTSLVLLPTTIAWLAMYTISARPAAYDRVQDRHASTSLTRVRATLLRGGGITHCTLFPRILPISLITSATGILPASAMPSSSAVGRYIVLAHLSFAVGTILLCATLGGWKMYTKPREGLIRLRGESRMSLYEKEGMRQFSSSPQTDSVRYSADENVPERERMEKIREGSSWVSSPSRPPTPVSSFAYTYTPTNANTTTTTASGESFKTPRSKPSNSSFAASASFTVPSTGTQHGPSSAPASAFGSATTLVTPPHLHPDLSDSAAEGVMNDQSWLSEPTNTPSSIASWSFPPSPEPAITRARSPSPSTLPLSPTEEGREPNMPKPGKLSTTTTFSETPGSASHSRSQFLDGSIIADYSPDPFHPLPRGFESLTSFPISPSNLDSRVSLATRSAALRSADTLACVPVEKVNGRGSSTWTLQSYYSPEHGPKAANAYKTPDHKTTNRARKAMSTDRRAPPPPPMPVDMPLPPTPTVARSSTLFDIHGQSGKDSMELLMGMDGPERDWVEVEREEDALEDWGRGSTGVGVLAVVGTTVCFALAVPLFLSGPTSIAITLYLISLLLPSPILALTSWLLRYQPLIASGMTRAKQSSTKTTLAATHRSLALLSESQLSLPLSISPKLTPPAPKRASTLNFVSSPTLAKTLEPKPSLTTFVGSGSRFGSTVTLGKSPERRHTVYGGLSFKDIQAEETMRSTLVRRSGDVWIESGHAIEGGGLISRATEILKPVPAMRVMDQPTRYRHSRDLGTMRTLRGGIVSMLANRASRMFDSEPAAAMAGEQEMDDMGRFEDADAGVTASPARSGIAISIIAPSPDKRASRARSQSLSSNGDGEDAEPSWQSESAQITMAQRGRMSNGPMLIFGKRSGEEEPKEREDQRYQLDWLTAGVLPNLVPHMKIGKDVRVEPAPHSAPIALPQDDEPDTPKARPRPLSDDPVARRPTEDDADSSYATMPSFHAPSLKDQSTPHTSRGKGRQHTHTRSYSSSIDLSRSPEYYTAETATSASRELRQRNFAALGVRRSDTVESRRKQNQPSYGLPKLDENEDDFGGDMRRSFAEIRRPHSGFMDADEEEEGSYGQPDGVDLPPIPATLTLTHKPCLSRVTEQTEEPTVSLEADNSAIFSNSALEDMHLALALASTGTPSSGRSGSKTNDPLTPGNISLASSTSTNEAAVDEMERMMAMDTPTRAEFVISPPPSASTFGGQSARTSRASERSVSTVSTSATGYTATTTSASNAEESAISIPPVPSLPEAFRQPTYQAPVFSHPYPPPLAAGVGGSAYPPSNLYRNVVNEPHYAVQSFLPRTSTESLHSISTAASTPTSVHRTLEARPSKSELRMLKLLQERNEQPRPPAQARLQSAMGYRKGEKDSIAAKRGLRPLTLVEDSQSNRFSMIDRSEEGRQKRFSVLHQVGGGTGLPGKGTGRGDGKRSKGDKENAKRGSKTSTGSAVVGGMRGLRA